MSHINALQVQEIEVKLPNAVACSTVGILQAVEEDSVALTVGPEMEVDISLRIFKSNTWCKGLNSKDLVSLRRI